MRKQPRSAAVLTAIVMAFGTSTVTSGVIGAVAVHAEEDRTDSPEYTASRADYWEARAAYHARKAATQARKGGLAEEEFTESGEPTEPVVEGEAPVRQRFRATEAEAVDVEPEPVPVAVVEPDGGPTAEQWAALRWCESGDDYGINTGNGYYGAYQFSPITWWWLGYQGYPHQAPPWVQDQAARDLWNIYGWSPWPACSRYLGFL